MNAAQRRALKRGIAKAKRAARRAEAARGEVDGEWPIESTREAPHAYRVSYAPPTEPDPPAAVASKTILGALQELLHALEDLGTKLEPIMGEAPATSAAPSADSTIVRSIEAATESINLIRSRVRL